MAIGGNGITGQGTSGGSSNATSPPWPTGGGGGWKTSGETPTTPTKSGSGGEGGLTSITGSAVYYGGGGGGGSFGGTPGRGGIGGGGNGGITNGQSGTAGLGGGGGGTNTGTSGAGGAGVVIIRYDAKYPDLTATGNPVYINLGDAKVYKFLSSGTVNWQSKTVTINDSSLPIPTYNVVPNVTNVDEGVSVTFTVTTTYVGNNTTLYWRNTGTRLSSNFDDNTNTGTVTIINGTGTIIRPVKANNVIDTGGAGTIIIVLSKDSGYTSIVATSDTVTVNDTSFPTPIITIPSVISLDVPFTWTITGGRPNETFTITSLINSAGEEYITAGNTYGDVLNSSGNFSSNGGLAPSSIYPEDTYSYTFTFQSGKVVEVKNISFKSVLNFEYLIVAGGGGSASLSGGGGAGGMLTGTVDVKRGINIRIDVGSGGGGGAPWSVGGNGGNSGIIQDNSPGIFATGGGRGASYYNGTAPGNGGSGGGGAFAGYSTGGDGINGQGWDGGSSTVYYGGGGGGGAGDVGGDKSDYNGGNGGNGLTSSITGTSVYYAGGGAGSGFYGGGGTGGAGGGGGAGGYPGSYIGYNGTVNTGGGGGGGGYSGSWTKGGDGGSGIVIIKYPTSAGAPIVTGSPNIVTLNGYYIIKFLVSGTFKV